MRPSWRSGIWVITYGWDGVAGMNIHELQLFWCFFLIYLKAYGDFLKWGYPQIIHFNRIFHEINHPAIVVSPFMESPI
jgi:hypothetical protein